MYSSAAIKVGISHLILFSILTYVFLVLGFTLKEEQDPNFKFTRRGCRFISGCFVYLVASSLLLLYGVLKKRDTFVKIWLISSIIVSVVLIFILLGASIYVVHRVEIYWSLLLCTMPFVLGFWMADGMSVVFTYFKKETKIKQIRKNLI